MQLAAGVLRVVHAADAQAAARTAGPGRRAALRAPSTQVLAAHVEGELAAVDDDRLDRVVEAGPGSAERLGERVGDLVEPAAVRPLAGRPGSATVRTSPP